ncbi:hypothetical protein FOZ63_013070, partial [Perkinsus olseni]
MWAGGIEPGIVGLRIMRYNLLTYAPCFKSHSPCRYSFLILSLAACSEVFGFVVMTPQVFLNYRLKSVEHLPWRALSYQAC